MTTADLDQLFDARGRMAPFYNRHAELYAAITE